MAARDNGSQRRRLPDEMRDQAQVRPLRNSPRAHGGYRGGQGYPRNGNASPYRTNAARPRPAGYDRPDARAVPQGERRAPGRNPRQEYGRNAPSGSSRPQSKGQSYGNGRTFPTKQAAPKASGSPGAVGVLKSVGSAIVGAFLVIWRKSRIAAAAIIAILFFLIFWLVSSIMPHDHIADGVHVGDLDVSGMTVAEAATAIEDKYTSHLNATTVYVFADEETANSADIDLQMIENEAQAEQLSFEEAQSNKKLWIASAESLNATLPSEELAAEALELGNGMGFFEKLLASPNDLNITPRADFDEGMLSSLIDDINSSLGSPVENYDLDIEEDGISVKEGTDGYLLDNAEFEAQLSDVLLVDEASLRSFVADIKQTPYVIDADMAASTKAAIEACVPGSIELISDEKAISFDHDTLMSWVDTRPTEVDGTWYLEPYLNPTTASKDVLEAVNVHDLGNDVTVTFDVAEDDRVTVDTSKDVALPNIDGALQTLDGQLFDSYRTTGEPAASDESISIGITMSEGKSQFSLEEALSYGLVTKISSFTTQYANTSSTVNRTHNIHLVSDTLNNTVARADGGTWSFLDHAGPMEESDGYREAGVIVAGQMDQGVGGGVCQVATTVFNAVYEAGLDIDERHNHTLYTSSYPAGLDAAVSYPGLDFIWSNPLSSDVLLVTSYTDSSVTVTLIGIDPEYEVETQTGEWQDGKEHSTEYVMDENLREGASYVKTAPTDGRKITVTRIVRDKDGGYLGADYFFSVYSPVNRIIAYGEGSNLSDIKAKYAENEDV